MRKGLGLIILVLFATHSYPQVYGPIPESYNCIRTYDTIVIDGKADEAAWQKAVWSGAFTDIRGKRAPEPLYETKFRMLWDDSCLYVYALLEEPHIWATLTERESVIFHDNDFEVFIDPDGDNHLYMEFEINAFGTEWDLLLTKPYEDNGIAINAWDFKGIRSAVSIKGSINNPSDTDTSWAVEIAMPWESLIVFAPGKHIPLPGDIWRMNFSRVEWEVEVKEGKYEKKKDPETAKPLPENNWVWSKQRVVNMHRPETWGYVRFVEENDKKLATDPDPAYPLKAWLIKLYYFQKTFYKENGHYAADLTELNPRVVHPGFPTVIEATKKQFLIIGETKDGITWYIDQDRKLWSE